MRRADLRRGRTTWRRLAGVAGLALAVLGPLVPEPAAAEVAAAPDPAVPGSGQDPPGTTVPAGAVGGVTADDTPAPADAPAPDGETPTPPGTGPAAPAGSAAVATVVADPEASSPREPDDYRITEVRGGAFGYHTMVSLFGGPSAPRGPGPVVTLPAAGSATPVVASLGATAARYGPADIFVARALSVSTAGTLGTGGSVTTSTDVTGYGDTDAGRGPFLFDGVTSSCSANGDRTTGQTRITGGVLETKYNPTTQDAIEKENLPTSPAVNFTRTGTIDHVGDSYRIVFNEQSRAADGTLTVNAAHLFLLGPTAIGELVVGQARCGVTAVLQPTTTTTTTTTTRPTSASTGSSGSGASSSGSASSGSSGSSASASASGSSSGSSSGTGTISPASVLGTSQGRTTARSRTGTAAPNALAHTGAESQLPLALPLLAAALVARRARFRHRG